MARLTRAATTTESEPAPRSCPLDWRYPSRRDRPSSRIGPEGYKPLSRYRAVGKRRQSPFADGTRVWRPRSASMGLWPRDMTHAAPWMKLYLLDRDGFLCVGLQLLQVFHPTAVRITQGQLQSASYTRHIHTADESSQNGCFDSQIADPNRPRLPLPLQILQSLPLDPSPLRSRIR